MGKKTTTRFVVTVTHRGPVKKFNELFHSNYNVTSFQSKTEETKTEKTAVVSKISDDLKIVRALLKKAAEKSGLKHVNALPVTSGNFKIHYTGGGLLLNTSIQTFFACLDGSNLNFSNETMGAGNRVTVPFEVVSLAEPNSLEEIAAIIKKYCL